MTDDFNGSLIETFTGDHKLKNFKMKTSRLKGNGIKLADFLVSKGGDGMSGSKKQIL